MKYLELISCFFNFIQKIMIERIYQDLSRWIPDNRALIIYGPRRVGKTTLIEHFANQTKLKFKVDSGDNIRIQNVLSGSDFTKIKEYAEGYDLIIIDEAQNIPGIGKGLKILVDQHTDLKIIATGSSSFTIQQQIGEPLTGRKRELILYPLSMQELHKHYNKYELKEQLENVLIYGTYPEIFTSNTLKQKQEYLDELVNSYLFRDILSLDGLRHSDKLLKITTLLSFQVGSEVSLHELAQKIGVDIKTVERYIELLEKSFIIYKLRAFSRNLRNEITRKAKYYFYDNGIRNAIIKQFNELETRNDIGQLWENFIITERMKKLHYERQSVNTYFWRTYQQKEIDYIEEQNGKLSAFEFKFNKSKVKPPKEFMEAYSCEDFRTINSENYLDFVL